MSGISRKSVLIAALSLIAVGPVLTIGVAKAGDVTADQILKALTPESEVSTRGLSIAAPAQAEPAPADAEGKFLKSLRNRTSHSLSTVEREEIATLAENKPKIDLEINFDYNSAQISAKSVAAVQALGRALASPSLKGATFVVAGHTDAAGRDTFNQELSERRADAIKRYLVDKFRISPADLVAVGYGKTKLKDPANPLAEANRRVQVVNFTSQTASN